MVQRLLTADGDVAGSADSIFAIFGFAADAGARAIGAIAAAPMSYRVIAKLRHRKLSAIGGHPGSIDRGVEPPARYAPAISASAASVRRW